MEPKTASLVSNATKEYQTAFNRWVRFTNEVVNNSLRLGRPMLDAYLKGLSDAVPAMTDAARKTSEPKCKIPETDCPPYCICELEWDACEDSLIMGSLTITNTGKNAVQFTLQADTFKSAKDESGQKIDITPDSFNLAPGDSQQILIRMAVNNYFDPNDLYEAEIKVRGRYEQCVKLRLFVRRNVKPHCTINHGEIPRHIVAHNWYDHFQCEELCFEPIKHREPVKPRPQPHNGTATVKPTKKPRG